MHVTPAATFRSSTELFAPIARDLDAVERILRQTLQSEKPGVARLISHLAPYRGKRLRPALLLLTAKACGNVTPAHHTLAAVVEMIHTATLVHDDVLDGATVRRHAATVNAGWGNQASILLGDWLFTHAFHLASSVDARACRLIGESTNRLCAGELHQICERGNLSLTEDDYLDIIDGKTAELTACCCRLGALYAGAGDEVVEHLANYGRCLGMAFQIADDLLDLVGDEGAVGKSLGTDLEQQKLTLPLIRVLRHGPLALAERVRHLLANPDRRQRTALRACLTESDGFDYARRRAEELVAKARRELACLPPSPCRALLEAMSERVVHRSF